MFLLLCVLLPLVAILWHDLWLDAEPFTHQRPGGSLIRIGSGEIFSASEQAPNPERFATLTASTLLGTGVVQAEFGEDAHFRTFEYAAHAQGPHWLALATKPRVIALEAEKFNDYLVHDGLGHLLDERKRRGIAGNAESEEYRKCARALVGVGKLETADYRTQTGLELELRLACRPEVGQRLAVEVIFHGKALPGFVVQAGRAGGPRLLCEQTTREGIACVLLDAPGRWYLRGIHMLEVQGKPHHYESVWASTTFEL